MKAALSPSSKRTLLALLFLSLFFCLVPLGTKAATFDELYPSDRGAVMQTPYMVRGRFVFVEKVSRRVLRAMVLASRKAEDRTSYITAFL